MKAFASEEKGYNLLKGTLDSLMPKQVLNSLKSYRSDFPILKVFKESYNLILGLDIF